MAFIVYSSVPLTLEINPKHLLTSKGIFLGLQCKLIELQSEFCLCREWGEGKSSVCLVRIKSFTLAPQSMDSGPSARLEMQNLVPSPDRLNHHLHFQVISRGSTCMLKFEKLSSSGREWQMASVVPNIPCPPS